MHTLHPPIHLLRAFLTTARQSTISGAAMELHLTQGAVSKQVLELESLLEVELFLRLRGRLVLSPAGEAYLPEVSRVLDLLGTATLNVMAQKGQGGVLNLSTTPSFGAKWLIPRLPSFLSDHPEVLLNFLPFFRDQAIYTSQQPDCSFRYGEGVWAGMTARYVAGREFVLIAPPKLPSSLRLRKRGDVCKHALIQHPAEPMAWLRWCEKHKVRHPNPVGGPKLDQVTAIIRAVMAGLGVGLVPRCLVEEEIASNLVIAPFPEELVVNSGFFICHPEGKDRMPAVRAFLDWVDRQCLGTG